MKKKEKKIYSKNDHAQFISTVQNVILMILRYHPLQHKAFWARDQNKEDFVIQRKFGIMSSNLQHRVFASKQIPHSLLQWKLKYYSMELKRTYHKLNASRPMLISIIALYGQNEVLTVARKKKKFYPGTYCPHGMDVLSALQKSVDFLSIDFVLGHFVLECFFQDTFCPTL